MFGRAMIRMCCLVLPLLAAGPALSGTDRVKLKNGALCQEQKVEPFEGATYRCYFSPHRVGKHDFSTRNARAMYVISEIGPDCDEIEILADSQSETVASDGSELRQVTVHCTR